MLCTFEVDYDHMIREEGHDPVAAAIQENLSNRGIKATVSIDEQGIVSVNSGSSSAQVLLPCRIKCWRKLFYSSEGDIPSIRFALDLPMNQFMPPDYLQNIKELRRQTGLGLVECKQALINAEYSLEKALADNPQRVGVRQGGGSAGRIFTYSHRGRIGVLLELQCETDFAANTIDFQVLGKEICVQIAGSEQPFKIDAPLLRDPSKTVEQVIAEVSARLGESIVFGRCERWSR